VTTMSTPPAAALAADQPLVPVGDGHLGAVSRRHFGRVGLDWWRQSRHQTISRTRAAAALPKVIGGPEQGLADRLPSADRAAQIHRPYCCEVAISPFALACRRTALRAASKNSG
jgi:hypothetical protein